MTNQQLQRVNFGQAKALKALGFDWPCLDYYLKMRLPFDFETKLIRPKDSIHANWNYKELDTEDVIAFSCPTVSLALKWARDVKGILATVEACAFNDYWGSIYNKNNEYVDLMRNPEMAGKYFDQEKVKSYEDYESALLDAVIAEIKRQEGVAE